MHGKEPTSRPIKTWLMLLVLAVVCAGTMVMVAASRPSTAPKVIRFSDFTTLLKDQQVDEVVVQPATLQVTGITVSRKGFRTTYPPDYQITQALEDQHVKFSVQTGKSSNAAWLILLGAVAFIVVLILVTRSRQTAAKASAGAPGRMIEAGEVPVTFKDVAGVDEVVAELEEIKQFLADPERFRKLGATIPKGVLLFGPPGTGKTLLARAVAGEAGVPFFSISGSDFVEMYVGVGASRVRKLFEAAKQQAPCVVFIDEIDAVGRRRSGSAQGGQEERENTLNQLLVEIDGFAPTDNVIVMAASNRADILDPALTRPGRFDRQVIVDSPDRNGRLAILQVHGAGKPFGPDIDLEAVAGQTAGFCGADLANLVNEAALLAARGGHTEISAHDMDEAIMRVIAGPQKTRLISAREKRTIAAHEIGHAILAHVQPESEPVHKVTIVSRGRALGLMVSLQEQDKLLRTRSELMSDMVVALGGRVAEELCFGEITTGAENDLERVNMIAQSMVLKYGMSDAFALRALVDQERMWVHSESLSAKVDREVDAIVTEAKRQATEMLSEHMSTLEHLTEVLIERETIDKHQFERLMRGEELPALESEDDFHEEHAVAMDAAIATLVEADALSNVTTLHPDGPGVDDDTREESRAA